jgi:hypothetical protein
MGIPVCMEQGAQQVFLFAQCPGGGLLIKRSCDGLIEERVERCSDQLRPVALQTNENARQRAPSATQLFVIFRNAAFAEAGR